MGRFADWLGTTFDTFRIGRASLDASGLSTLRSYTLPNKAGTVALLDDITGGGAADWISTTANVTMTAGDRRIADSATTLNLTLPLNVPAGKEFIVHARQTSHRIVSNGNVIDEVGSGNDLLVADGETAHLVAYATGSLRIV